MHGSIKYKLSTRWGQARSMMKAMRPINQKKGNKQVRMVANPNSCFTPKPATNTNIDFHNSKPNHFTPTTTKFHKYKANHFKLAQVEQLCSLRQQEKLGDAIDPQAPGPLL